MEEMRSGPGGTLPHGTIPLPFQPDIPDAADAGGQAAGLLLLGRLGAAGDAGVAADGAAVRAGQTGTYGELKALKRANGEAEALDMDHQPSFAAQVAARESALGRSLTPAERATLKANTPAVASPRAIHQQTSPTYGGRNSPGRIAADAANLGAAAARDRAAFDQAMRDR